MVINALAPACFWYVASLIHVPDWVYADLNKLVFKFFWGGKRDLFTRVVVTQPSTAGGFGVVDPRLKVSSLLVQWVGRLVVSPNSWASFLTHYVMQLGFSLEDVLSYPLAFDFSSFPLFYRSLLTAWRLVDGVWSSSRASFKIASSAPLHVAPVYEISAQSVYRFLLSENRTSPHCVLKFFPSFGRLYWPSTWNQLYFLPIDRPILDLSWKVAHRFTPLIASLDSDTLLTPSVYVV